MYKVTINGKTTKYEGSQAFINSIRVMNHLPLDGNGKSTVHAIWTNSNGQILVETQIGDLQKPPFGN